jgi:pimeloyl-ACP methyl ester carboxylesterase
LQSRHLAHHGRAVLALDLPGHGRSDGPPLGVAAAGAWVAAVVEAAGLSSVALVGHSMGSLIALEAAARLGTRARALILVGTAYPMQVSPKLLALSQSDPLAAIDLVNALSHSTLAAKPSNPGPGFSVHGGSRALMRRMQGGWTDSNLFHADFAACDAWRGLEGVAPQVACPVTLVLGERDQMTSPKAVAPLREAFNPRVVMLPAGHDLMAEDPDGLLKAIVDAGA